MKQQERQGRRVASGTRTGTRTRTLCEDEPRVTVHLEDLLDGVDVRRRPQVQTQLVPAGRLHDLLQETRFSE